VRDNANLTTGCIVDFDIVNSVTFVMVYIQAVIIYRKSNWTAVGESSTVRVEQCTTPCYHVVLPGTVVLQRFTCVPILYMAKGVKVCQNEGMGAEHMRRAIFLAWSRRRSV
jgi:hypothetical protein